MPLALLKRLLFGFARVCTCEFWQKAFVNDNQPDAALMQVLEKRIQ